MAGVDYNPDTVKYLVASDLHDTLKNKIEDTDYNKSDDKINKIKDSSYEKFNEKYLPKHCAIAKTAQEQGAEFIALNGDLVAEDEIIQYLVNPIDEKLHNYVQNCMSSEEQMLYSIGQKVMEIGKEKGIDGVKKIAKNRKGKEKEKLEGIIKRYEIYGEEKIVVAIQREQILKNKFSPLFKEEIKEVQTKIENYYRNQYIPAMIEAYSNYSGKVLMIQGNHDPDVFRELDGVANFVFIDQLPTTYKHNFLEIAAAGNFDKINIFPHTNFFPLPDLYKNCEFDSSLSEEDNKKNNQFMKKNEERFENMDSSEAEREIREFQKPISEKLLNSSPVNQRFKDPAFDKTNMLMTHAGPSFREGNRNWNALNARTERDKKTNKRILDNNKNFVFEEPIFNNGPGLDNFINKSIYNKLDFVHAGHIHDDLPPSTKQIPLQTGEQRTITASRTSPETMHLCTVQKNKDTDRINMVNYKTFKFKEETKTD